MKTTTIDFMRKALFLWMSVIISFTSILAQVNPNAPKVAVSNLAYPDPVIHQETKGAANLPEQLTLGFSLELEGILVTGNWDIQGKIVSTDSSRISFITESNQKGNLVYRIPREMTIVLKDGDPISIKRIMKGFQSSLGYELAIKSFDYLHIYSGKMFSEEPLKIKISDDLSLYQDEVNERVLNESKYETFYMVPVELISDQDSRVITVGQTHREAFQDIAYSVFVKNSSRTLPAKEYEGLAEGSGYALEYLIVIGRQVQ